MEEMAHGWDVCIHTRVRTKMSLEVTKVVLEKSS